MTIRRALLTCIETPAGDSAMDDVNDAVRCNIVAGAAGGVSHVDDAAFTAAVDDVVPMAGFYDSGADNVDDGDAGVVRMSANRNLYVVLRDAAGNERGLNVDASGNIGVTDAGGTLTVDGTVTIQDGGGTITVDDGGLALSVDDAGGSLTVDQATHDSLQCNATIQVGDVDVANGNPVPVSDAGGTLTIDNATLSVTGGGAEATALRVTIANDSTGVITVDDGGTSLTVDQSTHDNLQCNATIQVGDVDASNGNPVPVSDAGGSLTIDDGGLTISVDDGGGTLSVDGTVSANLHDGAGTALTSTLVVADQALDVNVVQTVAGSGGTSMTDDAAFTPGTTDFTPAGGTYRSVRDSVDDNDAGVFAMTQTRALLTCIETPAGDTAMDDANDAVRVNVVAGAAGGVSHVDDAAFTAGTDDVVPMAGFYDSGADNVDDGDAGVVRMSINRNLYVELRDAAGNERGLNIDAAGNIGVTDAGGTLTIDNATLAVVGGGAEATALRVTIANDSTGLVSVDDGGGSLTVDGAGTSMADDTTFTPGTTDFTPVGGTYRSVRDSVDDNDAGVFAMTQTRALLTCIETPTGDSAMDDVNDAVRCNIVAGAAGGVSHTDDTAFTAASDDVVPIGGFYDSTADAVDDGDAGAVRMSENRNLYVNIRDAAGNERGLNVDAAGNIGVTDAGGTLTIDNATLAVVGGGAEATALRVTIANDSTGVLSVDDNNASLTVDQGTHDNLQCNANIQVGDADVDNGNPVPISDAGGTLTIDNATLAVVGGGAEATALRVTIANDSTGVVSVDDGGTALEVQGDAAENDPVAGNPVLVGGRYDSVGRTLGDGDVGAIALDPDGAVHISDGGNAITIDNTTLSVVGGGAEATALRVTIANDSTGVLSVDDNNGSLTVDQGTHDNLQCNANMQVGDADVANGNPVPVSDAGGTLTIDNATLSVTGGGAEATALRVTIANDSTGLVSVDDGGTALEVQGDAANDAAVAGNPVLMGGYYNGTIASGDEVDDGDAVRVLCDLVGGIVRGYHPGAWVEDGNWAAAQTDTTVRAAPGAGLALYVTDIIFSTDTAMNFFLESGATTIVPQIYCAANGGWSGHFQTPIRWPTATAITITSSAAGNHSILIMGYTAP
jgi:hypothetical protein